MTQYTVTFRYGEGHRRFRFRFITALSVTDATEQLRREYDNLLVLTVRENVPPLETVTECSKPV